MREEGPAKRRRQAEQGSVPLVALGFLAALTILLAIPLLEALFTPGRPVEAATAPLESRP